MNLFGFLGIPDCARQGCGNPGIVRVRLEGPGGEVWADLCIACVPEIPGVMGELSQVAHEETPLLGEKNDAP